MSEKKHYWLPPGKNCGLCGETSCKTFLQRLAQEEKVYEDCPYYDQGQGLQAACLTAHSYTGYDVLANKYDFVLHPLPEEISARKIVLPFRGDAVERLKIVSGDLVLGRPMGAGCPIPHVLRVIKAEEATGLLYTWVVGPQFSREQEVKDVVAYHMIGFEGIAAEIKNPPQLGYRMTFLPGFCMMNLNHTGLVNMVLEKKVGYHVRIEDIRILASQ